ncbi:asciclin domain-containing protein [Octadecabacter antarcticus 307]|uniref:Asciclin domain-containing protein n=1 Tax=Octadecabacter antarcticus 307 TaxID=391626 RepID=M9R7Q4_9RHOB|nr:fasciclin domain-containing protein [Octadecabacter antarcticus]AGI65800.1 asciclin domain-containing protein [Octadecabacter antarcticus 307]
MLRRTFMAATATLALTASTAFADGHSKDIVDTAVDAGTFTTLVAAVTAAGLVDTLKSEGPFTVFAPTDEAFAALPEGTVEGLLADPEALTAILTYHVVAGKVMSGDLSDGMTAATVNGADVTIMTEGGVMVNGANVVTADIEASNGVIHVIDTVLMPPM